MKKTIWKYGLLSIEIDCEPAECIITVRYGSYHDIHINTMEAAKLRDGLLHIGKEIERMREGLLYSCSLCGIDYLESEIEEKVGYPPEYICKHCYETVPAKEYDEHTSKLHNEHRWDYE